MNDKKNPFGYLVAGLVGAVSALGLAKLIPTIKDKCCGSDDQCCCGHETPKPHTKKKKK
jgi:hypothetical protein